MKPKVLLLMACLPAPGMLVGCGMAPYFTNPFDGHQTLPPARTGRHDVQYFPATPDGEIPNLKRALEQYKLEQQGDTTPE